jgi:diguanylate cyclase (GGDEF)-like protein
MGKYDQLSDVERRKLAEGLRRAAEEIRAAGGVEGGHSGMVEHPQLFEEQREITGAEERFSGTQLRRPSYALRVRIDSYAFSEGFEICGLGEFAAGLLSFLSPAHDRVRRRFIKTLVLDSPSRGDPSGYSLSHTLLELQKTADSLLKGGSFLRREADRKHALSAGLARELAVWEPDGLKLLTAFQRVPSGVFAALDNLRACHETGRGVDVFELAELVRAVVRASLYAAAPAEAVRVCLAGVGELIKVQYRRIFSDEGELRRIAGRVDRQVEEFLACWNRLKWFAHQLYPPLLKMLRVYRREEQMAAILPRVLRFVGLEARDMLSLERPLRPPQPVGPAEEARGPEDLPPIDFAEEFRGILTILGQAFPGCRIERIPDGDFSTLFWFHQKIFGHPEYRGPLVSRRPDFNDLLWKVSHRDPVGVLVVLHELVAQMLDSLAPGAVGRLLDPLVLGSPDVPQQLVDLRARWSLIREALLLRYLRELDDFQKQLSLHGPEKAHDYLSSAAGRRALELANQLRNHLISGYGQVALRVNRQELFHAPPLFSVTRELCALLTRLVPDRRQAAANNPIPLHRLETAELVQMPAGPLLGQIAAWIEAVPQAERLLVPAQAEANRLFLEILYGAADLLDFLAGDERSPLRGAGGELFLAGEEDQAIRAEIERDRTPLRVELRRDFEQIDRLTGLRTKNEYLRLIPMLFRQDKQAGRELTFLVMDLDRFKSINDTLGHEFGDVLLALAGQAVLAACREEDPAVRFGGDELLVVVRGDCAAGASLAERIRTRFEELKRGESEERLAELPERLALSDWPETKNQAAHSIGTLSIGAAQGLGPGHPLPCPDEQALFKRADRMLYLAKSLGGNVTVVLVDELGLPLSAEEHAEYLSSGPRAFLERRQAEGLPLTFAAFSYEQSLAEL